MNYNDGAIAARKPAIIFLQEHTFKGTTLKKVSGRMKEAKWTLKRGPCDETTKKPNPGVAVAANGEHDCKAIHAKMHIGEFIKMYKAGRAAMYEIDQRWESNMMVFNTCDKSGGK